MRPIETDRRLWATMKEAAAETGRDLRTVQRWVSSDLVRTYREPGGRVMVYRPDYLPPGPVTASTMS